jgi:multisubunit Na+/H+ antiporter MnhF subunit
MFWLVASVVVLGRVLRLRLDVIVAMVALWLALLWLQTAEKTGPQIAVVLTVVSLVGLMVYAELRLKRPGARKDKQ